jgi:hypothetical protein
MNLGVLKLLHFTLYKNVFGHLGAQLHNTMHDNETIILAYFISERRLAYSIIMFAYVWKKYL